MTSVVLAPQDRGAPSLPFRYAELQCALSNYVVFVTYLAVSVFVLSL